MKTAALILIITAILAVIAEQMGGRLPTISWVFSEDHWWGEKWSWVIITFQVLAGLWLWITSRKGTSPLTQKRLQRFRDIRRGWLSFLIMIGLVLLAALDWFLVGNTALVVSYNGEFTFPAFTKKRELGELYSLTGSEAKREPDYRKLKRSFSNTPDWLILPLVPYAPTGDSVGATTAALEMRKGHLYFKGEKYSGLASIVENQHEAEKVKLRYRYRQGLKDGIAEGKNKDGLTIYRAEYKKGQLIKNSEQWSGAGDLAGFLEKKNHQLVRIQYPPSPPSLSSGHLLGTTLQGYDVLAYLYGGLQVNIRAAIIFLPCIYLLGISIGLLMGYFGGWFDLLVQRLIEVLENVPFLFIVMIVTASLPESFKGLGAVLLVLIAFGWMGMTNLMRTAAYKEKSRDYVAAARVMGGSTFHILRWHILPNTVAILVTLIPFSAAGLVSALTALDYLGFGLPAKEATWGRLLSDGLERLDSPWLVSASFVSLSVFLVLITFVGEAVREAFDPKKRTYYR